MRSPGSAQLAGDSLPRRPALGADARAGRGRRRPGGGGAQRPRERGRAVSADGSALTSGDAVGAARGGARDRHRVPLRVLRVLEVGRAKPSGVQGPRPPALPAGRPGFWGREPPTPARSPSLPARIHGDLQVYQRRNASRAPGSLRALPGADRPKPGPESEAAPAREGAVHELRSSHAPVQCRRPPPGGAPRACSAPPTPRVQFRRLPPGGARAPCSAPPTPRVQFRRPPPGGARAPYGAQLLPRPGCSAVGLHRAAPQERAPLLPRPGCSSAGFHRAAPEPPCSAPPTPRVQFRRPPPGGARAPCSAPPTPRVQFRRPPPGGAPRACSAPPTPWVQCRRPPPGSARAPCSAPPTPRVQFRQPPPGGVPSAFSTPPTPGVQCHRPPLGGAPRVCSAPPMPRVQFRRPPPGGAPGACSTLPMPGVQFRRPPPGGAPSTFSTPPTPGVQFLRPPPGGARAPCSAPPTPRVQCRRPPPGGARAPCSAPPTPRVQFRRPPPGGAPRACSAPPTPRVQFRQPPPGGAPSAFSTPPTPGVQFRRPPLGGAPRVCSAPPMPRVQFRRPPPGCSSVGLHRVAPRALLSAGTWRTHLRAQGRWCSGLPGPGLHALPDGPASRPRLTLSWDGELTPVRTPSPRPHVPASPRPRILTGSHFAHCVKRGFWIRRRPGHIDSCNQVPDSPDPHPERWNPLALHIRDQGHMMAPKHGDSHTAPESMEEQPSRLELQTPPRDRQVRASGKASLSPTAPKVQLPALARLPRNRSEALIVSAAARRISRCLPRPTWRRSPAGTGTPRAPSRHPGRSTGARAQQTRIAKPTRSSPGGATFTLEKSLKQMLGADVPSSQDHGVLLPPAPGRKL
ncbi:basic proline-rich protein-like [Perognathus longimembris pacificus]|uniref:basic proline-rich protein-like n=1 Tax=Perognathus longimembris pacificus TaxID=214514 RepID=UPI002018B08B|nr:basic proline-rich protein-like [Perognathus longimembris pacificus]